MGAAFGAGCLCGGLRLTATGTPKRVGICHCLDCRKHHGAAFYAAAVFDAAAVDITGPAQSYEGRAFCARCGSSVFARSADEIEVHLGAMDDPNALVPTYELWCIRRAPWLAPFAGTTCYERGRDDG
ncbi:GFA family protein [uncultured Tateyamaria sp.]|uniref:GFA family protein n=1 Tax=uncultured Tateyamaria sp. TaxID=455651 RepID=UPI002617E29D|nr:GFA family protein [uncultured Tateyamaria sp.]